MLSRRVESFKAAIDAVCHGLSERLQGQPRGVECGNDGAALAHNADNYSLMLDVVRARHCLAAMRAVALPDVHPPSYSRSNSAASVPLSSCPIMSTTEDALFEAVASLLDTIRKRVANDGDGKSEPSSLLTRPSTCLPNTKRLRDSACGNEEALIDSCAFQESFTLPPQELPARSNTTLLKVGTGGHSKDPPTQLLASCLRRPEELSVSWSDFVGAEGAITTLRQALMLPRFLPHLFTSSSPYRQPPKCILLYGPPGTGKTMLAEAAAKESGSLLMTVSASDLLSKWVGGSEKQVKALFDVDALCEGAASRSLMSLNDTKTRLTADSRRNAPFVVIFLDEIDSLCGVRGASGESEAARRVKTEFLVRLQALDSKKALVIAATNTPWDLDAAFRRRFQRFIHVTHPSSEARATLIRRALATIPSSELDINSFKRRIAEQGSARYQIGDGDDNQALEKYLGVAANLLASDLSGYSTSEITTIVQTALSAPLRRIEEARVFKRQPIEKDGELSQCLQCLEMALSLTSADDNLSDHMSPACAQVEGTQYCRAHGWHVDEQTTYSDVLPKNKASQGMEKSSMGDGDVFFGESLEVGEEVKYAEGGASAFHFLPQLDVAEKGAAHQTADSKTNNLCTDPVRKSFVSSSQPPLFAKHPHTRAKGQTSGRMATPEGLLSKSRALKQIATTRSQILSVPESRRQSPMSINAVSEGGAFSTAACPINVAPATAHSRGREDAGCYLRANKGSIYFFGTYETLPNAVSVCISPPLVSDLNGGTTSTRTITVPLYLNVPPLRFEDFLEAAAVCPRTTSTEELERYRRWETSGGP